MSDKTYIGDGVYVDYDGYQLVLTTEEGMLTTNTIYLDAHVFRNLTDYAIDIGEGIYET
jgi:hypothetical protein